MSVVVSRIVSLLQLKRNWPMFGDTAVLSIEALGIEAIYSVFNVSTTVIAIISITLSGSILLIVYVFVMKQKLRIIYKPGYVILGAALFALSIFLWYDSIPRIGAGKAMMLQIPLETVFIVLMAWVFLLERLKLPQMIGIGVAIVGVGCALVAVSGTSNGSYDFGLGEVEAILSAAVSAASITIMSKQLSRFNSTEVTGFRLIIGGIILIIVLYPITSSDFVMNTVEWSFVIMLSIVSLINFQFFAMSVSRSGVSMTSIVTTSSIVLTLILQMILLQFGISMVLPQNIPLAVVGSSVSILGIYLVFRYE